MPLSVEEGARLIALEAHLRRLEQGGGGAMGGAEWTHQRIEERINAEEAKYPNIPRGLAKAVAYQESAYHPEARGDGGRAQGFFQLHAGAAKDAGIDPSRRGDPELNIQGGVKYVSMVIDRAKGDIPTALSLYNRGTPDYRGIGDPNYIQNVYKHYKQGGDHPGILARGGRALSPASAEAATAPPQGHSRLDELEAELARRGRPAPPPAAAQPPALSTPAPPGASQGAPAPTASMERFLTLPSIRQLPPSGRQQAQQEFAALRPDLQAEFLRGEEPASDLTVSIEKPSPIPPRTPEERAARVREELAAWERQAGRPWREGDPRMPSDARLGAPDEPPLEEGITKPSTMIPLLMPGAGLTLASPLLTRAAPFVQRLARPVAEGVSQTAGWTAGRTAETGQVPSPGEIGTEAALTIATGGVVEIPGAVRDATRALLRRTPGAQILLKQQAVDEAEGLGTRVFAPAEKAVVSKVFEDVAATGAQLDVQPVREYWKSLIPDERRIAARELKAINPRFAEEMLNPQFKGWDIGELQDLRSHLLNASSTRKNPATQDLLQGMRSRVDEAITQAMSKGSLSAAQLVQAQAAWRKVRQAQDLQGMVAKHTRESPNLTWQELNLAALSKDVHGGGSKAARTLMEGMSKTEREVLQQELESLKRHYPFVRVNETASRVIGGGSLLTAGGLALTGNLPGAAVALLPVIVTAASRSPTVMSLLKRSIIEGKGRLAPHHVDALLHAIRHENEGEPPAQ